MLLVVVLWNYKITTFFNSNVPMGTVIVFFISIYYYFSTINVLIALCKNHTSLWQNALQK